MSLQLVYSEEKEKSVFISRSANTSGLFSALRDSASSFTLDKHLHLPLLWPVSERKNLFSRYGRKSSFFSPEADSPSLVAPEKHLLAWLWAGVWNFG